MKKQHLFDALTSPASWRQRYITCAGANHSVSSSPKYMEHKFLRFMC